MQIIYTPDEGIRTDLFHAIKFETRRGKSVAVEGIQFPQRFVLQWMFDVTWKQVSAGVITATPYRLYSTEDLFDDSALWDRYDADMHRVFGRCLAYFSNNKMLPLACVNPDRNNKLYQKIDRKASPGTCMAHALPMVAKFNSQLIQGNFPCPS